MKHLLFGALVILALVITSGCAAAPAAPAPAMSMEVDVAPQPTAAAAKPRAEKAGSQALPGAQAQSDAQAQAETRMIVYTGAMSLQVNDTAETIDKIDAILKNVNGYVASKSVVAFGKDKLRGTISVRIPAAALDTTLGQIKALAVKVLKESADSNDVTAEYVDLDARRKNLEAYEIELQKLLETVRERTGKAEDILAVYNQLTEVRGQIEQLKGRQTYLENTSALATYSIELVPVEQVVVEGEPGWNPGKIFAESLDALVRSLQTIAELAIRFVVQALPILLLCLLPVVLLVLLLRWFIKRRQAARSNAPS